MICFDYNDYDMLASHARDKIILPITLYHNNFTKFRSFTFCFFLYYQIYSRKFYAQRNCDKRQELVQGRFLL